MFSQYGYLTISHRSSKWLHFSRIRCCEFRSYGSRHASKSCAKVGDESNETLPMLISGYFSPAPCHVCFVRPRSLLYDMVVHVPTARGSRCHKDASCLLVRWEPAPPTSFNPLCVPEEDNDVASAKSKVLNVKRWEAFHRWLSIPDKLVIGLGLFIERGRGNLWRHQVSSSCLWRAHGTRQLYRLGWFSYRGSSILSAIICQYVRCI